MDWYFETLVHHDVQMYICMSVRTHVPSRYCEKMSIVRVKPRARLDAYGNGERLPLYGNGYDSTARGRSNHCDQLALFPAFCSVYRLVMLLSRKRQVLFVIPRKIRQYNAYSQGCDSLQYVTLARDTSSEDNFFSLRRLTETKMKRTKTYVWQSLVA